MQKIGLFPGSFNPPHKGHLSSVLNAHTRLGLDKTYMMPIPCTPTKTRLFQAAFDQKMEMCQLLAENYRDQIEVSDHRRDVPSNALGFSKAWVKSFSDLTQKNSDTKYHIIVGEDQASFARGLAFIIALQNFSAGTSENSSFQITRKLLQLATLDPNAINLHVTPHEKSDFSSQEIRRGITMGEDRLPGLTEKVRDYIKRNHIYTPSDYDI